MRPWAYTLTAYEAVDTTQVAAAQAISAGVPMTLTAPTLDIVRPVTIVSVGNESANRFHIVGTGPKGYPQRETINGANAGTAESRLSYGTIASVTPLNNGAGNVSVGIATAVPTPWHVVDYTRDEFNVTVNAIVIGTLATGYRIEAYHNQLGREDPYGTIWDMYAPIDPANAVIVVAAATASARSQIVAPCTALRLVCLEALGAGESIRLEILQGH